MDLSSKEDLSPLFLQFLDCVWQVVISFCVIVTSLLKRKMI